MKYIEEDDDVLDQGRSLQKKTSDAGCGLILLLIFAVVLLINKLVAYQCNGC